MIRRSRRICFLLVVAQTLQGILTIHWPAAEAVPRPHLAALCIYNSLVPFDRELIEAQLALELISNADMPKLALDAMEAGVDGRSTWRLAALDKPTYFEVRDILPTALREMGLSIISKEEAALRIAKRLAAEILSTKKDPMKYLQTFERLWIRADYPKSLCSVGTLSDELYIRNPTQAQEREFVISRLREFIR